MEDVLTCIQHEWVPTRNTLCSITTVEPHVHVSVKPGSRHSASLAYGNLPCVPEDFSRWRRQNWAAKPRRRVAMRREKNSPTSTTRSDAPRRWRTRRPLASRVMVTAKTNHVIRQIREKNPVLSIGKPPSLVLSRECNFLSNLRSIVRQAVA